MQKKSKGFLNTLAKIHDEDFIEAPTQDLISLKSNYLKLLKCITSKEPLVKESRFESIVSYINNLFGFSNNTTIKDFFIIKFILNFLSKEPQN
ncbi:hypothetical protein MWH28_08015 [Natroniella sulfidigena]|uniref:hypothetical protein n=1 Tax=Natroniella sulfidigena TaxID=723921 RepID=UPI00200B2D55|nr:hypothetical protein [Natroniella sulfidigena]MCK8817306.1 hypothetical protein [Natroniella sulfidigena]